MTTQMHEGTISDVLQAVDFTKPAPHLTNAEPDLLDTDSTTALLTAAAVFSHPDIRVLNEESGAVTDWRGEEGTQAVAWLAMFAAGGRVRPCTEDYRRLDRQARAWAQHAGNREVCEYVLFVCRAAVERAIELGVVGSREPLVQDMAELDLTVGRGYGPLDVGLPADFDQVESKKVRLTTYATMFAHPLRARTNTGSQAVMYLALYALGARVALTRQQFRLLERRLRTYMRNLDRASEAQAKNGRRAHYVLMQAQRRARRSGLI